MHADHDAWNRRKAAARKYQPQRIRLLLVAESPPAGDRYFYFEGAETADSLFLEVCGVLFESEPRGDKAPYLKELRRRGIFVMDLKPDAPRVAEPLGPYVGPLLLNVDTLAPEKILLVVSGVYDAAHGAIEEGAPARDRRAHSSSRARARAGIPPEISAGAGARGARKADPPLSGEGPVTAVVRDFWAGRVILPQVCQAFVAPGHIPPYDFGRQYSSQACTHTPYREAAVNWTTLRSTRLVLGLAALALASTPLLVHAGILTSDTFTYPNGPLVGNGGWQAHSAAGTKAVQVNSNAAIAVQSAGSGEDVNKRWFVAQSATAATYASFLLTVPSGATLTGDDYFAHFRPGPPPGDTLGFKARVYVGPPGDATHYSLGLSVITSATSPVVHWPTPLLYGQTYRVVTEYDAAAGTAMLWVDPLSEASANIVSGPVAGSTGSTIESYCLRQSSGNTSNERVDDLKVGTVFEDVSPTAVPGAGTLALVALGTMLASGAALYLGRRRLLTV